MKDAEAHIRKLTFRYAIGVDRQDIEEMLSVFTPDAVFDARPVGQGLMEGIDGIRDFFVEQNKVLRQSHHVTSNHIIEVEGESAHGTVYFTVEGRTHAGEELQAWGYYDDQYILTPDGWKISHRIGVPLVEPKLTALSVDLPVS